MIILSAHENVKVEHHYSLLVEVQISSTVLMTNWQYSVMFKIAFVQPRMRN